MPENANFIIMHTQDKLKVIEGLTEKPSITKIGNQSLKAEFPCGCYFVQHLYTDGEQKRRDQHRSERELINRYFFAELCKNH